VFIEAKDDGGGGDIWTTGAISRAKLQSNHHHQQNVLMLTGIYFVMLLYCLYDWRAFGRSKKFNAKFLKSAAVAINC